MSRKLSEEEINQYHRDGYLVVSGLLAPDEVEAVSKWAGELQEAPDVPGGVWKYGDDEARDRGESLLSRIEYFHKFHDGLRELIDGESLSGPVGQLFGETPALFKDKINYKLAGGAGFTPHQDIQAGWGRYCATHMTILLTIDEATPENGCLELAAGHHKRGLIGTQWEPMTGEDLAGIDFASVPAKPGDAAFFDSYTPHQSAPNLTREARRVLYVTYNPASQGDHYEQYFADKHASYPPDCERDDSRDYRFRV